MVCDAIMLSGLMRYDIAHLSISYSFQNNAMPGDDMDRMATLELLADQVADGARGQVQYTIYQSNFMAVCYQKPTWIDILYIL